MNNKIEQHWRLLLFYAQSKSFDFAKYELIDIVKEFYRISPIWIKRFVKFVQADKRNERAISLKRSRNRPYDGTIDICDIWRMQYRFKNQILTPPRIITATEVSYRAELINTKKFNQEWSSLFFKNKTGY